MGWFKSDPPAPPNPAQTAAAQTGTNVSTAVANSFLSNMNQITPDGMLRFDPTDTYSWTDPSTGANYNLPRFTSTQLLSPAQQGIHDLGVTSKTNLAGLAANQSGMLRDVYGQPIDTSGGPSAGDPNALGGFNFQDNYGQGIPGQQYSYGNADDFSSDRKRVEEAMYQRLDPQLQRDRGQLEARLADQGIKIGSPAYQAAMDQFGRQLTDTRLGITERGGVEQKLLNDMAMQKGQFFNAAQAQDFAEAGQKAGFYNTAQGQRLTAAQAKMDAETKNRARWLTEQYAQRNAPLNEIASLMSGSQVSQPNFNQPGTTSTIPTTDYAGLVNNRFSQDMGIYQQQSQNFNALVGGAFGAAAGYLRSDKREKDVGERMGTVFGVTEEGDEKKLPIYEYAYKDDPAGTRHVGPMAQDVERIDKKAVKTIGGTKYINKTRLGSILKVA